MARAGRLLMLAFAALALTGCVERRFVITSEPFGAMVYDWSDVPIGPAPADAAFEYYGTYRFKLVKDGYKPMIVDEPIKTPWYAWPGLDFVSENLVPFTFRDIRRLHYKLEPVESVSPDRVRGEGEQLRQRGQGIGTPLPQQPLPLPPLPKE